MITQVHIQGFKSILDYTLELGRINVFIGENGAGKTNFLEALATAGAAIDGRGRIELEDLYARGVRIAKPSITLSSFLQKKSSREVDFTLIAVNPTLENRRGSSQLRINLRPKGKNDIDAGWKVEFSSPSALVSKDEILSELTPQQIAYLAPGETIAPKHIEIFHKLITESERHERMARNFLSLRLPDFQEQLKSFCIYNLNALALRGIQNTSRRAPLGINGENLDVFLESFSKGQLRELIRYSKFIPWFGNLVIDTEDELKFKGHKLGRSTSRLYFRDRFMRRGNNVFSAENANEGILHILFYLALFVSDKTPPVFAIDNIETALNPQLCRELMKSLVALAKTYDKQVLITTHNPAILDGLDLHDDDQRLFVVYRNDHGHTVGKRIKLKPKVEGEPHHKLSELWMRGHLGGLPKTF